MPNAWMQHVAEFRQSHPNLSYKQVLQEAKHTYQPQSKLVGGSLNAKDTTALIKSSYDIKNKKDIGDFKVDKSLSGKRTKVYFNEKENKPVIVHRGTKSIQDMGSDVGLAFGHRGKRFKHAKKMQKKAEKKYGKDNMQTLGHSLGGIVAEEIGNKSQSVITLNKAKTPFGLNKKQSNQHDIKTANDPVSALNYFHNKKNKNTTSVIKSKSVNPLKEHSSDTLKRVKDEKIFGKGITRKEPLQSHKPKNVVDKFLTGYTKSVSDALKKHQHTQITSIKIVRTPLKKLLQSAINVFSMGRADKNKIDKNYDDYFHLYIIINNKFILEKNEGINFAKSTKIPKGSETMIVKEIPSVSIKDLLTETRRKQGSKYFRYSASSNNCQRFIQDLLIANGIGNTNYIQFVKQDTDAIFKSSTFRKFANTLTDTHAIIKKI